MRTSVLAALLLLAGACAGDPGPEDGGPEALMVVAPHPDDEALGCAGLIRRTIAAGGRVRIVIVTNGDGFPGLASLVSGKPAERLGPEDFVELGRFRQRQSRDSLRALGGHEEDLVFLGYPDSALVELWQATDPVRQKFTGRTQTYGTAGAGPQSAPYTRSAAVEDLVRLIRNFRPDRICVTSEADTHGDHRATAWLLGEAARRTGFAGQVDAYLVHGGKNWPLQGGDTPGTRAGWAAAWPKDFPSGLAWPPPVRLRLTEDEVRSKRAAIAAHASHLAGATSRALVEEREYLESFGTAVEAYWPLRAPKAR